MAGDEEAGKLHRLPSGKHGLPREYVSRNHRERLTAGVIAAVAEHGFRDAGVTQIAAFAGVSRRTFYDYFSDKDECYFAAYGPIEESLLQIISEAGEGQRGWTAKVRVRAQSLVDVLAANPNLVRFAILAPPTAGGKVVERQRKFLRRLLDRLTADAPEGRGYVRPGDEELEALAGAMAAVFGTRVADGKASRLPEDVPQLVEMILVPFVGRRRAAAEAETAGPR